MSETNEQPIAGRVVEGAGNVAESAVRQVEGAAVEATEFLSDSVLARAIGLIRAAKTIVKAGAQGTLDVADEGSELLIRELDEFREATEQAVKDAAGGTES
jgi:hypothetical protein